MLAEDRSSLFGGGGAPGAKIVGGPLEQVKDPEAKELFSMLAVLAEDVPAPMPALELIWCAKKGLQPCSVNLNDRSQFTTRVNFAV